MVHTAQTARGNVDTRVGAAGNAHQGSIAVIYIRIGALTGIGRREEVIVS